jgi:sorbose reductase
LRECTKSSTITSNDLNQQAKINIMSMTLEDAAVVRQPKPVPNTPENVLEQFSMKGKVVAITGASDGIGWAVAEAIAEAGGDLALWYNTNNAAISKGEEIAKKHGIRAKAYQVEVSDHEAVKESVDQVVKDFGRLDVFVANAGMAISKAITEQTIEEYRKQMSVNGKYFPSTQYWNNG